MIRRMIDIEGIDEAQLTCEAERMAEELSFSVEVCRAIVLLGLYQTRRDEQGRLLADPEDIEDALLDGDEVMKDEEQKGEQLT